MYCKPETSHFNDPDWKGFPLFLYYKIDDLKRFNYKWYMLWYMYMYKWKKKQSNVIEFYHVKFIALDIPVYHHLWKINESAYKFLGSRFELLVLRQ